MTETGELIFEWLKDQYPSLNWQMGGHGQKDNHPVERLNGLMADPLGGTKGLTIILEVYKMTVTAYIKTRHLSKIRSVELHDPKSIDGLKELVDHVMKVCTMPASFTKFI